MNRHKGTTALKYLDTTVCKRTEEYLLLHSLLKCYLQNFNNLYVNTNTRILHNLALKDLNLLERNKPFSMHLRTAVHGNHAPRFSSRAQRAVRELALLLVPHPCSKPTLLARWPAQHWTPWQAVHQCLCTHGRHASEDRDLSSWHFPKVRLPSKIILKIMKSW